MFIRQAGSGDWYVCRRSTKGKATGHAPKDVNYRNWFLVKHHSNGAAIQISGEDINLPLSFLGKRVRLKIEVIK